MKKVILIGTSFSAAPIYFALKRRGFHVTVCGGSSTDPCHQYADNSIHVNYADRDLLYKVIKENQFDYIVPTCNDYSYLSASWVASQMGYPGYDSFETTEILHTKKKFREVTSAMNLPAPRMLDEQTYSGSKVSLPYLVKPVDSFSGRGVSKVETLEQMPQAIKDARSASRSSEIVIEEFVSGALYSHSAFISDQKIAVDFFVDEFCTVYPYQVNCSHHPSRLSEGIRQGMRSAIDELAKNLKINDGLLHTQFMSNGTDFWIVECMRRCPGDLYGSLIERSTGVDYTDLFILPFIGEKYNNKIASTNALFYGRHTISTKIPLVNFSFSHQIPAEEVEVIPLKGSGEQIAQAPFDKLAILLARFTDEETMLSVTPELATFISVKILSNQSGL